LVAAAALASTFMFLVGERVVCPSGYSDAELARSTKYGKRAVHVVCRATDGSSTDGSLWLGALAWLGAAIAGYLAVWHLWRAVSPPPEPPPVISRHHASPRDKRERRRARKQREHHERQK
jgi:hypothetical protein